MIPGNLPQNEPLPDKVKIFALLYDGNPYDAIVATGLKKGRATLLGKAKLWLKDKRVQKIIQGRLKQKHAQAISTREERQAMWARAANCQDPLSLQILERIQAGLWQLSTTIAKSGLSQDEWGNLNLKVGELFIKLQKNALKASEILGKSQADFVDVTLKLDNVFTYAKGLESLQKHIQGSPQLENQIERNLLDFIPNEEEQLNKVIDITDFVFKTKKAA